MFNFKFTVMRQPDLQRITLLGFKIFKTFKNFKTTVRYYLSNFPYFISGQCSLFVPESRRIEEKIGPKNIQVILFSW